jgi:sugar-specific transcriptional regulator TrmB
LVDRGAVVTLPQDNIITYAAVPAAEFLAQLGREQETIITSLRDELSHHRPTLDPGLVWTIKGHSNIMTRARSMIDQATSRVYLALLPAACSRLQPELEAATNRGVQVVVYTTNHVDLQGGRVVVTPVPNDALDSGQIVELILVRDGQEALLAERLGMHQARASWTRSPVLVTIAENHLLRGGRHRFLVS